MLKNNFQTWTWLLIAIFEKKMLNNMAFNMCFLKNGVKTNFSVAYPSGFLQN